MRNGQPIGVFDSGLGGLTVVKEIVKILPHEDVVYLGDTARVPYGTRSKDIVTKFSQEDANFLLEKKVKCIVIACNTASAYAGDFLKRNIKIPVFDVITPAIKMAVRISDSGNIGVIGTTGTISSGAYDVKYSQACPLFVPFIEEGEVNSPALKLVAKKYLNYFNGKIDTLILGCTHYPIIESIIKKETGNDVQLVNPGKSTAEEVLKYLKKNHLLNNQEKKGNIKFFATDLTVTFTNLAGMFLGEGIKGKINRVSLIS